MKYFFKLIKKWLETLKDKLKGIVYDTKSIKRKAKNRKNL